MGLLTQRKLINRIALTLSMLAMTFGLFRLVWVQFTNLELGILGVVRDLLAKMMPPLLANKLRGVLKAIVGNVILLSLATARSTPTGSPTSSGRAPASRGMDGISRA